MISLSVVLYCLYVLALQLVFYQSQVVLYHALYQFREGNVTLPAQDRLCLCRIAQQYVYFCRTEELLIDGNHGLAGSLVDTDLVYAAALPLNVDAYVSESSLYEFPNGAGLVCLLYTSDAADE